MTSGRSSRRATSETDNRRGNVVRTRPSLNALWGSSNTTSARTAQRKKLRSAWSMLPGGVEPAQDPGCR